MADFLIFKAKFLDCFKTLITNTSDQLHFCSELEKHLSKLKLRT